MNESTRTVAFSPRKALKNRRSDEEDRDVSHNGDLDSAPASVDEVDGIRKKARFDGFDVFYMVFSIISYLADLATDLFVATGYFLTGNLWWFGLTLGFILIPAITVSGLSIKWYLQDRTDSHAPPVSKTLVVFRVLSIIFFLNPIVRYAEALHHGLQSWRLRRRGDTAGSARCYARMAYEDADATFLRLFECFMESAPQLVLQLYILARTAPSNPDLIISLLQASSVVTSLVSLAWAMTSYNRSVRYSQVDKANIGLAGTMVLFLHHLSGIAARVLALSLFASAYTWFVWLVCFGHWVLMATWLWLQKTAACSTKTEELLFCLLLAVIHVFTFFNVKPDRTVFRYTFYYMVCLMENTALIVLWFLYADNSTWWYYPGIIGQVSSFGLSVMLLAIYYSCLHPNSTSSSGSPVRTTVGICTKDAVCLSDRPGSPVTSRLGRLDEIRLED